MEIRSTLIADPNNGDILRDEWKKKSHDKRKTSAYSIRDFLRRLLIADLHDRHILSRKVLTL
jgi:hypothetical protein